MSTIQFLVDGKLVECVLDVTVFALPDSVVIPQALKNTLADKTAVKVLLNFQDPVTKQTYHTHSQTSGAILVSGTTFV